MQNKNKNKNKKRKILENNNSSKIKFKSRKEIRIVQNSFSNLNISLINTRFDPLIYLSKVNYKIYDFLKTMKKKIHLPLIIFFLIRINNKNIIIHE